MTAIGAAALVVGLVATLLCPTGTDTASAELPVAAFSSAASRTPDVEGESPAVLRADAGTASAPTPLVGASPLALIATHDTPLAGIVVRESDGTPLEGARVTALATLDELRGGEAALGATIETDATGSFAFSSGIAAAGPAGFFVEWLNPAKAGFDAQQRFPLGADLGPPGGLSLRVDTGWILNLRIRDEFDQPVEGAYVRTPERRDDSLGRPLVPGHPGKRVSYAAFQDYESSDETGVFALRDLRWSQRALPVVVFAEGFETSRFEVQPPLPGTWRSAVDVVLHPPISAPGE